MGHVVTYTQLNTDTLEVCWYVNDMLILVGCLWTENKQKRQQYNTDPNYKNTSRSWQQTMEAHIQIYTLSIFDFLTLKKNSQNTRKQKL